MYLLEIGDSKSKQEQKFIWIRHFKENTMYRSFFRRGLVEIYSSTYHKTSDIKSPELSICNFFNGKTE